MSQIVKKVETFSSHKINGTVFKEEIPKNNEPEWHYTPTEFEGTPLTKNFRQIGDFDFISRPFQSQDEAVAYGVGFEAREKRSDELQFVESHSMAPWYEVGWSDHDMHWFKSGRGDDNWMSIFADEKATGNWKVAIYPVMIDGEERQQSWRLANEEIAAHKVAQLMEEHND